MKTLGKNKLYELMQKNNMSFKKLSQISNISESTLREIANNKLLPIDRNGNLREGILEICDYFFVNLDYIFPDVFLVANETEERDPIQELELKSDYLFVLRCLESIFVKGKKRRNIEMFLNYYIYDLTFSELSKQYNISPYAVSLIVTSIKRKLIKRIHFITSVHEHELYPLLEEEKDIRKKEQRYYEEQMLKNREKEEQEKIEKAAEENIYQLMENESNKINENIFTKIKNKLFIFSKKNK